MGHWLVRHLEAEGDDAFRVFGPEASADAVEQVDLRDAERVYALISERRPEAVYHLAALSFGPDAARDVDHAIAVNVLGTANLLSACASLAQPPFTLIASSAEVYASLAQRPIVESDAILPATAYGATKLAGEAVGLAYDRAGLLPVAIARPFNHIGPGQRPEFALPSFARQLAQIVAGIAPPEVAVGNLTAVRDFTDVRDVVRAYRLIVASRVRGLPMNVASGRGTALGDVLEQLIALSGASVSVEVDRSRLRPVDIPTAIGDSSRLRKLTGWQPAITIGESLKAVWEDALARYGSP